MPFIDPNKATIEAYNKNIEAYTHSTPLTPEQSNPVMLEWIDFALSQINKNGRILEIGSATPRDALYMRSKGFTVLTSDAATGFLKYLQLQGEAAIRLNLLTDNIPYGFDMIFANAVFPHFTQDEVYTALAKTVGSLKQGGIFAFSIKIGQGEGWIREKFDAKRYTHYWQENEIEHTLAHSGFKVIFKSSNIGNLPNHLWLNIVAQKP